MPVGCRLTVDRPAQIQRGDDSGRRQIKFRTHDFGQTVVGQLARAAGVDVDRDRILDADRIGDLKLDAVAKPGRNQILADMFGIDVSDIAGSEDDVKSAVEEMVYTEMLTTAIAEKENITVSDDEYTDYVNSVYEESGYTSAEEYEEDYTKDETVNTILYNKVMDFLMQNATVTEVSEDEYYEEDTEMDEEAYETEEITENETDAEDLEMTE